MPHRPRAWPAVALLLPALVACGAGAPASPVVGPSGPGPVPASSTAPSGGGPGIGPAPTTTPAADPPSDDFPKPHPDFARHFADPLYHDEADELAPFGSDEGWDTLYTWAEQRDELTDCTTVRAMFDGEEDGALADALALPEVGPDVDALVVGTGFSLLLLRGRIDPEGKQLVLDALRREARWYDDPTITQLPVMVRDLESFPPSACGT